MPRPRSLPVPAAPRLPSAAATLGRPPLIPGENHADYETMLARVTEAVRPDGIIEEAWVRDVVDLIWQAVRARRLKAALMTTGAGEGLFHVLRTIGVPFEQRHELVPRWAARQLDAVAAADAELEAAGLDMDHVMAETLRMRLVEVERIDRMAASAEARRAATLREISHYRASFAATLRADAAIDAEFAEVAVAGAPATAEGAAEPAVEAAE